MDKRKEELAETNWKHIPTKLINHLGYKSPNLLPLSLKTATTSHLSTLTSHTLSMPSHPPLSFIYRGGIGVMHIRGTNRLLESHLDQADHDLSRVCNVEPTMSFHLRRELILAISFLIQTFQSHGDGGLHPYQDICLK